jgi:hypothetical protein
VAGRKEENDPLLQARRNARDVNRIIKENCRIDRWVKPLVVFVGEWKIKNKWRDTEARVFSTDQIIDYLDRQQAELMRREIPPSLKLRRGRRSDLLDLERSHLASQRLVTERLGQGAKGQVSIRLRIRARAVSRVPAAFNRV